MSINIEKLEKIYSTNFDSPENKGWIAVPDSKIDTIIANAKGSSGGNPGNGWKIHISIDPEQISQAVQLIAQELNDQDAPRVSIKFAGKQLALTGQPGKQVAFIFYEEELKNIVKIAAFLNRIEFLLKNNNIGMDSRPINSDVEGAKTKYDASLLDNQGKTTRFNYRNENCIVMEDELYSDVGGTGNTLVQDKQIWVKQSYYMRLPNSEKHNPGNHIADPLTKIRIESSKLNVEKEVNLIQEELKVLDAKSSFENQSIEFRQFFSSDTQTQRTKLSPKPTCEEYWNKHLSLVVKEKMFHEFQQLKNENPISNVKLKDAMFKSAPDDLKSPQFRKFVEEESETSRRTFGGISVQEFWDNLDSEQKEGLKQDFAKSNKKGEEEDNSCILQ
jgi:hypothetical protein